MSLAGLAILAGCVEILIHRYDPTRILYKRLKAEDRYVYDEIDPRFLKTDPHTLLSVERPADLSGLRDNMVRVIWGGSGFPDTLLPAKVEIGIHDEVLSNLPNLGSVDRLTVQMEHGVRSYLYHLIPASARRKKLVIYHHGYAGDIRDVPDILGRFLAEGYSVLGISQLGYGGNTLSIETADGESANLHFDLDKIDAPLHYHIEPAIVGINYAGQSAAYDALYMVGFSAGAFTATIVAAIDQRITKSYPVAGVYPVYLRVDQEVHKGMPAQYPPLLATGSYLDFFVAGAAGRGRSQLQIFNRYDRCCYNNRKGKLYESAVADTVQKVGSGGRFHVAIDESHADHRISERALDLILRDMASASR